MSRELQVMRHGKSAWDTDADTDFDRPLAKRGRRAVKAIAGYLLANDAVPHLVASSPARRARQTAKRLCRRVDIPAGGIVWEDTIYEASVDDLLAVLARLPGDHARVMIVGHNPGFDELVRYLGGESSAAWDDGNLMPTAALARIEMPRDWAALAPACGRVREIVRPRELQQAD